VRPHVLRAGAVLLFGSLVLASCQLFSGVTGLVVDPEDGSTSTTDGPPVVVEDGGGTEEAGDATADGDLEAGDAEVQLSGLGVIIEPVAEGKVSSITVTAGNTNIVLCATVATCIGTVQKLVPSNVPLTIKAVAAAGSDAHFLTPTACKTTGSSCATQVNALGLSVKLRAVAANYAFVTSQKFPGNLGGLAGADAKCTAAATTAGLPGTYVAWLSDAVTDASTRLGTARGFVRVDGLPFADTVANTAAADLVEGKVFYPLNVTENGTALASAAIPKPADDFVFTGTLASGATSGSSCVNWTAGTVATFGGGGSPFAGSVGWTNLGTTAACNTTGRLYCFRKDRNLVTVKPAVRPAASRLAFVSQPFFMGANGIADADTQCAAEATAALLPGTYRAYLATTTAAAGAAARFDLAAAKGGWYRIDDVPIFPSPAVLGTATVRPTGPLTQRADGSYIDDVGGVVKLEAWTGMNDKPNTVSTAVTNSCVDWTSPLATDTGTFGLAPFTNGLFTAQPVLGLCSDTQRYLYCLQQ